jgi:predicted ATPase
VKITTVRLRDFKSFADSGDIELGQINVFVDRNNTGKSTIIQTVHFLQQGVPPNTPDSDWST